MSERRDYFGEWKAKINARLGTCCVTCGSETNLEIDHIDESKKTFDISKEWGRLLDESDIETQKKFSIELENCQLLCKKCHREKTNIFISDLKKGFTHGSSYGWMKARCNCQLCLERKRLDQIKRNNKRRRCRTNEALSSIVE